MRISEIFENLDDDERFASSAAYDAVYVTFEKESKDAIAKYNNICHEAHKKYGSTAEYKKICDIALAGYDRDYKAATARFHRELAIARAKFDNKLKNMAPGSNRIH